MMRILLAAIVPLLTISIPIKAQNYSINTFAGGGLPNNLLGPLAQLGPVTGVTLDKLGNAYLSLADPYNVVLRIDGSGNITRVAGNGTRGFGGDGGLATSAQLYNPAGLAFDAVGNLYIAEDGNNQIRKVGGGIITLFAGAGTGPDAFSGGCNLSSPSPSPSTAAIGAVLINPTSIVFDSLGTLYIAERARNQIRAVSNGVMTTVAGNACSGFSGDNGLAIYAQLSSPLWCHSRCCRKFVHHRFWK